jgi:hypothetical protein
MTFKLQHPGDLISRLFILEYMREISAKALYEKANKEQKKQLFYKFIDEDSNTEEVDVNWEFCLFEATLPQLDYFISNFVDEVQAIEAKRQAFYKQQSQKIVEENISRPVDISVYDMAKAKMDKSKNLSNLIIPN